MPGKRIDWRRAVPLKRESRLWEEIPLCEVSDDHVILLKAQAARDDEARRTLGQVQTPAHLKNSKLRRLWNEEPSDLEVWLWQILLEPEFSSAAFQGQVFGDLNLRGFLSKSIKARVCISSRFQVTLVSCPAAYGVRFTIYVPDGRKELVGQERRNFLGYLRSVLGAHRAK